MFLSVWGYGVQQAISRETQRRDFGILEDEACDGDELVEKREWRVERDGCGYELQIPRVGCGVKRDESRCAGWESQALVY